MKRWRKLAALALPVTVAVAVALTVVPSIPGFAAPGDTTRVSVASDGTQGNGASGGQADRLAVSISADGRFVAFESTASNLVSGDTGGFRDIFVRDRAAGTNASLVAIDRVSVSSDGTQADSSSFDPSVSSDGRFVAFSSWGTNLAPADTNLSIDIFVRDRLLGTTERASVASDGTQANAGSFHPFISADGRFVAFASNASNLVAGDTNSFMDVFVHDRLLGTSERASVAPVGGAIDGTQANGPSISPSISADGRFVAFRSAGTNLAPGDTNLVDDIFVRDRSQGTTERVSVASDGTQANAYSYLPFVTADGRFVAFISPATNLVPGDANLADDIFVRDRLLGTTERASVASVSPASPEANGHSQAPSISSDGRLVAFSSIASNLVPADTNSNWDVFVRDRVAGTTERVSVSSDGAQADGPSFTSFISADGRVIAFSSNATNLVPGDTNGLLDVFVHELAASTGPTPTATATPTPTVTGTPTPTATATATPTVAPSITPTNTPVTAANSSLSLNGTSAYAEAPHAAELVPANWTFEVWFKDANSTYNHARTRILTKGDIASAEVPYFASIDSNLLYVGLRSGGAARILTFNLATGGITPNAWHHLAASFQASTRTLTIYIDGIQRAQSVLASASAGNSLPLITGRSGAAGDYWRGTLDDLRLWNVVRTGAEINANYQVELGAAPPGLVGNWRFDEGFGTTAFDGAGAAAQNLSLLGGATFSTDVPNPPPSNTPTPTATLNVPTPTQTPTVTPTPTLAATTFTPTPTSTPAAVGASSLSLNGSTAYAEAPHAAELVPANWTFEVWFKDANSTYNHARTRVLTKGDIASAEVPYFASIDSNRLYVGLRSGGAARTLTFNLATGGITPNVWHHLAASFQASTRTLTIYIDGIQRAQGVLASASAGNSLPLIVGRSGAGGDYWRGTLDDLRLWNVVRTGAEINANYQVELGAAPPGLVGNWRFDEGFGTTAADNAGAAQNMSLFGGATFSGDVP